MSEIEYDSSGKSNSSFQVGANILNFLSYVQIWCVSMCNKYLN